MEDLSLDRAPLEHAPLGRLELIQTRREERPQGGRDDDLALCFAGHRQHLLDEERVAGSRPSDPPPQLGGDALRDQLLDGLLAQGLEPKRHRPGRVKLAELRPREAEQQDRRARGEERHVLDQVAERPLAPLDVVEDDDQRPLRRSLLQGLAESPGDLLGRCRGLALAEERVDRGGGDLVRGQQVELLQDLHHRPVGDPLPVREAAAVDDPRLDRGQELRRQPRLADTRIADHRDELATPLGPHPRPRFPDERELALAPDKERPMPPLDLAHAQEPVGGNGLRLALQHERLDRLHLDRLANEHEGRVPEQHLARLGSLLEPRRHIHRVARRKPLLRPGHHLARHHADPAFQPELGQCLPHLERRPQRAQRVVLVHERHSENGHHRVADELLDAAPVPLHNRLHLLEIARQ